MTHKQLCHAIAADLTPGSALRNVQYSSFSGITTNKAAPPATVGEGLLILLHGWLTILSAATAAAALVISCSSTSSKSATCGIAAISWAASDAQVSDTTADFAAVAATEDVFAVDAASAATADTGHH